MRNRFREAYHKLLKPLMVEKPGASIHTPKWDRCVKEVETSGSAANAYAVCTAMMGSDAFKSMDEDAFAEKVKFYLQKLGIAGAGPVPNSLLSRQDLEGNERKGKSFVNKSQTEKSTDLNSFTVWYYDQSGARKCAVFGNAIDAEAFASMVEVMGFKDVQILKGQVEQTGKQLERLADKAEDAEETTEKNDLVANIKAVQVKRQKAAIRERAKETDKSFKETWSKLNKNSN